MLQLDPVIWFFVLGLAAGVARADLRLPAAIYEFVSTVLLLSIGLKGGVELARHTGGRLAVEVAGVLLLGFLLPLPLSPCALGRPALARGRRVARRPLAR